MATVRSRPRTMPKEDPAEEERNIWKGICGAIIQSKDAHDRAAALQVSIQELKTQMGAREMDSSDLEKLQKLYSELTSLTEKEAQQSKEALEQAQILMALRSSTESSDRAGNPRNERKRKLNSLDPSSAMAVSADSPSARSTQKVARSNSAVPTSGGIYEGAEVAFRLPKRAQSSEGEWIQCKVLQIIGNESKQKYVIEDPEPDETGKRQSYRTGAHQLIPIPRTPDGLPRRVNGTPVLARYPETTTFYPAIVSAFDKKSGSYRLRFDGEEEADKETFVEQRLVLELPKGEK